MKTCPKCGAQADGIFCLNCGAAVNSEPAPAPTPSPVGNDFKEKTFGGSAPQQPQQPYYPPQQPVQQPYYPSQQPYYPQQPAQQEPGLGIELLLCFFLGFFGAHKFYRKKIGMGLLYLFTYGLFGIGYLVDLITLFVKWLKTL